MNDAVQVLVQYARMSLALAFAAVLAASLPPDLVWYELGPDSRQRPLRRCP
jgi:hypothetical protein